MEKSIFDTTTIGRSWNKGTKMDVGKLLDYLSGIQVMKKEAEISPEKMVQCENEIEATKDILKFVTTRNAKQ